MGAPAEPGNAGYAELHCLSHFSFGRGASSPAELVRRAHALGYAAVAVTDECSLAGIVRAWEAARDCGIQLIIGAEFRITDGPRVVLLVPDQLAYTELCSLITLARRRSTKGQYRFDWGDLQQSRALLVLWAVDWPAQGGLTQALQSWGERLHRLCPQRLWCSWSRLLHPQDPDRFQQLQTWAVGRDLPLLATGEVHYHVRARQRLQDVLTCIHAHTRVQDPQAPLFSNGERHLRPLETLRKLYPAELLDETLRLAQRCRFELSQLRYTYPHELVPTGATPSAALRTLTEAGVKRRWPLGCPPPVRQTIERELALIKELGYEHYFLTVEDIVRFARERGILCQGRGSAANSAVCYALGVTEVDPARMNLLFERFMSRERAEPPDIDIDFEHQRREEVFQYIYAKYGRHRAALAATVICYRRRSAIRDVGKALGFSATQVDLLAKHMAWWDAPQRLCELLEELGFSQSGEGRALAVQLIDLVAELEGTPRHLSQHVGGFVISEHPLSTLVPVENAAMPERTIIQWDKDDLDAMGLLKVDCLALGMLTALHRAMDFIAERRGQPMTLSDIPAEDPATYAMISRGETIGVFQIESRAQMAMLPRLRPQNFFDLVIEVAIIRPGPIQGDMVHPYLRRRQQLEAVEYPSPELRRILEPTLGVPLFQEQVMSIAMVAAGFSAGEADKVRRSMAAWKRKGGLEQFRDQLLSGMAERGYSAVFAEQIYQQILGFGSYGFPQSHAASFALLTYASCWLKCHEPAAFTAALLNSQPMGFYAPAQLVNEARRCGVAFLAVDVNASDWDCTLSGAPDRPVAVQLGLRLVSQLSQAEAQRLVALRPRSGYTRVDQLLSVAGLQRQSLRHLAAAGALRKLAGDRHQASWEAAGAQKLDALLEGSPAQENPVRLRSSTEAQEIVADYRALGLTLGRHPLALLRPRLQQDRIINTASLTRCRNGQWVRVAGLVTHRQRPGTASGVIFVTLEDEFGTANLIVWPTVAEQYRDAVLGAHLLEVRGVLQSEQGVHHVVARSLVDRSAWISRLELSSRDFH